MVLPPGKPVPPVMMIGHSKKLQGADDRCDQMEKDHRRQHGQGHVAKLVPEVGPVDVSGIVEILRHILKAGQIENDLLADDPERQQHNGLAWTRLDRSASTDREGPAS